MPPFRRAAAVPASLPLSSSARAPGLGLAVALLLAPLLCLGVWPAGEALAQRQQERGGDDGLAVLIVDSQRILREADAVQLLQSGIESERDAFREQLREHEAELREDDAELTRERSSLTNDEYLKRRHDLEQRYAGYQSEIAERRRALEGRFSKGMRLVESRLLEIVRDLAEERGVGLVLSKSAVLLTDPAYDATEEVMRRLNDALPRVELPKE